MKKRILTVITYDGELEIPPYGRHNQLKLTIYDENDKVLFNHNLVDFRNEEGNIADFIVEQLSSCTHYNDNSVLSLMMGKVLNLKLNNSYDKHITKEIILDYSMYAIVTTVLYEFLNKEKFTIHEHVLNRINMAYARSNFSCRRNFVYTSLYLLYYTNFDVNYVLENYLNDKDVLYALASFRFYNNTDDNIWQSPIKTIDDELFFTILEHVLKLAKTKGSLEDVFGFMQVFIKEENEKEPSKPSQIINFEELKNRTDLFKTVIKKGNSLCNYVSKTKSYYGIKHVLWLKDYLNFDIFNETILKMVLGDYDTPKEKSKYDIYISLFCSYDSMSLGVATGVLGFMDHDEFKEIVDKVSDNVIKYYGGRSARDARYNMNLVLDKTNAILLMNTIIPKISGIRNDKYVTEFLTMFNYPGLINHADYGDSTDLKKKILKKMLKD